MTGYDPDKHHRRSIRLEGYDYTRPGAYFVTIVTHRRECLFGDVVEGKMHPNALGQIVQAEWLRTADVRPNVELDAFVIMPNHVHGILIIHDHPESSVGASRRLAPADDTPGIEPQRAPTDDRLAPAGDTPGIESRLVPTDDRLASTDDTPGIESRLAPTDDRLAPTDDTPGIESRLAPTDDRLAPADDSPGIESRLAPADDRLAPTDDTPHTEPRRGLVGPPSGSLGAIMAQFKSICTKRINAARGTPGAGVWQRNYYERIIRTQRGLQAVRRYILGNPARWMTDTENPREPCGRTPRTRGETCRSR